MGQQLSTGTFGAARWVVSSDATQGTNTTIASAITSATTLGGNQTIALRPGNYTEDFTWPENINLVAYNADALTPNVTIIGKITCTSAGTRSASGIRFQTNSDNFLVVSGSAATIINFQSCYLNITNATGISFTSSSSSATININSCVADVGTTGITVWSMSSTGNLNVRNSQFGNSGSSTTASDNSAGIVQLTKTDFSIPLSTSSTGALNVFTGCQMILNTLNAKCILANGSGGGSCRLSAFFSGTSTAITIGSGVSFSLFNVIVSSTNASAIDGAGSLINGGIFLSNTSTTIATTTITRRAIDGGSYKGSTVAPPAGMIGERISTSVSTGAPVTLTTATTKTVASVALTPGVWDVSTICLINGTLVTRFLSGTSETDNTLGAQGIGIDTADTPTSPTAAAGSTAVVPSVRFVFTANTTVYMVAQATFTGSAAASGRITAVRVA